MSRSQIKASMEDVGISYLQGTITLEQFLQAMFELNSLLRTKGGY